MNDPQEILNQQELLAAARRHLHVLVRQATEMGSFVPPYVLIKTDELRAQIGAIKATLRGWHVEVEDLPDDEARRAAATPSAATAQGSTYNIYGKADFKMGDTFDFSGANISGANLNVKATLTNVTQSIGAMQADDATKQALAQLMAQLNAELQKAPAAQSDDAEAVSETAKELVDQANKQKPNKSLITIKAENLKQAAQNILGVLPTVLPIATQIAEAIRKLVP